MLLNNYNEEFYKKRLSEALSVPSLRLPKNVSVSDTEVNAIKNVNWSDIKIHDLGGKNNIANLGIELPFKTEIGDGIIVDIQVINGGIYQIHIHMSTELQSLGLGYKIYKAIIMDFGHLYSGKGRRMNPLVGNIWEKLKVDNDIQCVSNPNGDLCMRKDNPNKKELVNFIV